MRTFASPMWLAIGLLVLASPPTSADAGPSRCDTAMRQVGGPCLEGVPLRAAAHNGILPIRHRTVMGFVVGRDDFAQAAKIFGTTPKWDSGDAASAETKLCYVARGVGRPVTIVLAQNAEMSRRIDEIRFIEGLIDSADKCTALDLPSASIRTASGVRVGMTRKEVTALLGAPTHEREGLLFYDWRKDRKLHPYDPGYESCLDGAKSVATLGSGITLRLQNGVVSWLAVGYGDYAC